MSPQRRTTAIQQLSASAIYHGDMSSATVAASINAASLGLGAFSTTTDLLHVCLKVYHGWTELVGLEDDLKVFKSKLVLQQALLELWKRDWYGVDATNRMSSSRLQRLQENVGSVNTAMETIKAQLDLLEPLRVYAKNNRDLTSEESIKFIISKKTATTNALETMKSTLETLCVLLPPVDPNIQASVTVLVLNGNNGELLQSNEDEDKPLDLDVSQIVQEMYRRKRLEQRLAERLTERIGKMNMALPQPSMVFASRKFTNPKADDISPGSRAFGLIGEKPVIVEWKGYDESWQAEKFIKYRGLIDNLSRFLGSDSKPDEMKLLKCIGYFNIHAQKKFGFCFEYPEGVLNEESIVALRTLLVQPPEGKPPSTADRIQVAYSLGLTLTLLHTAQWLHKGIRSHNILFPKLNDRIQWARPYLVGFEYSRPDQRSAPSERPEESARYNLYRHAKAQGTPVDRYEQAFDVYSFGVLLVEIATWKTAWKLWGERGAAVDFKDELVQITKDKVQETMGLEYRDATLKCLHAEWGQGPGSITAAVYTEVVEALGRGLNVPEEVSLI